MNDLTIMIILGVLLAIVGIFLFVASRGKNRNDEFNEAQKKNTKNYYKGFTRMFEKIPVIKRYFRQLKSKYRSLFPADEITIETMATKQMMKSLGISVAIIIAMVFICKGDIPYLVVGIVGAYVLFTHQINTSSENLEMKLLDQLDTFIDDLTSYYHDSHDIVEAVEDTLDDLPYEIALHAQKIFQIITSTDSAYEMEQYANVAPNQYLLLTAAVCTSIKEYGDKEVNGKSLFLTNLNYIKEELNQERIHLIKKKNAYYGKVVGILLPLFMFKFAETLIVKSVEETETFYKGGFGTIAMFLILLIDIVCYELINISKNTGKYTNEVVEPNSKLKRISEIPTVKRFLVKQQRKEYTKSMRTVYMLQGTGSEDDINTYTVKRWLWAIAMFVLVTLISFYSNYRTRTNTIENFANAYSQTLVPSESYRQTMINTSQELYDKGFRTEEEITEYLEKTTGDTSMASTIAEEITTRSEKSENYRYKWWMLLIGCAGAGIGYMIPYFLLRKKSQIMEMRRNDEVTQFKTLIMIFMHMDGMMLDDILIWMQRFSNIYKTALSECIMNYESGQQKALVEMKDKESGFAPFRRLCDSLIAVDNVGIENAFDSLEGDREFQVNKRRQEMDSLLKKEEEKANMYMAIPLGAMTIGYILLPFCIYALNMAQQFTGML